MPRLLLVDDNSSIHKIAASLLASTDIELVCAKSAAEALDLIDKEDLFDAALIDTSMSEMNGWELLTRLRAEPKTTNMPIGLMAGILDDIDPMQVEIAPIQAFLRKPMELRNLAESTKALMAAPVCAFIPSLQTNTSATSDILILEEQDLLVEEAEVDSSPVCTSDTEAQDSIAVPAVNNETAQPIEETISLDLEELNFSDIDGLVTADSEQQTESDEIKCESSDKESDDSVSPISADNSVSLISVVERDTPEESSVENPVSHLDALPEDFDPSVFHEENSAGHGESKDSDESQGTSKKITDEIEQIEGIHELLQQEFEPLESSLALNASEEVADSSTDDTSFSEKTPDEPHDVESQNASGTSEPAPIISASNEEHNENDEDEEDMKNLAVGLDSVVDLDSYQEQNILMPSASSLVSELLSNPKFIDAIAKAVAEKLKTEL